MTYPDDRNLAALIAALRDVEADGVAPAHVESALMQAWDAAHPPPAARAYLPVVSRFAGLAAGAVLAAGLAVLGGHLRSVTAVDTGSAHEASPTVILVGEPIRDGEQVRLVRMRIPASALHALGVRSTAASEDVDVDVIVGEDGVARGVSLNPLF